MVVTTSNIGAYSTICLDCSDCLSACLLVCLSVCLTGCLSVSVCLCLSVCMYTHTCTETHFAILQDALLRNIDYAWLALPSTRHADLRTQYRNGLELGNVLGKGFPTPDEGRDKHGHGTLPRERRLSVQRNAAVSVVV